MNRTARAGNLAQMPSALAPHSGHTRLDAAPGLEHAS